MENTAQLQSELSKKTMEYEDLLVLYKYNRPDDISELFRLKRNIVRLFQEKSALTELVNSYRRRGMVM